MGKLINFSSVLEKINRGEFNRFRLKYYICLVDEIPDNVEVNLEYDLHYWNEIEDFFYQYDGRIIDYRKSNWEIPKIKTPVDKHNVFVTSHGPVLTAGDILMTKEYKVYKIIKADLSQDKDNIYLNCK